ncbi:FHA domain-containing protein [Pedococcus sp. 5OH_020]|uniref:FHA domain-containing protein n=1 Tax=Pedococcus sp. 5OH_020 TaxID=2989814 RepID=UPI0022E9DDC4|nr:FHA domain-containing protein [Pedococcus sp. 5OH_020]
MSTATCPNGHVSASTDYCDTCGAPIAAGQVGATGAAGAAAQPSPGEPGRSSAAPTAPPAAGAASTQACPSCGAENDAAALFCEACGYDFTTGTMPRSSGATSEASTEAPDGAATGVAGAAGEASPAQAVAGSTLDLGTAAEQPSVAPPIGLTWVAEVWVDPDWYASQESEDPCPSPGLPVVVPLRVQSVLIGRPSSSRNIHPEIDCTGDPGVSRRQAQLTTDGQRWWVEDLQSSNGTYVGPASGPLPTQAVPPGQRRELAADDRVYLGAWTRLVVRRATPEEQHA